MKRKELKGTPPTHLTWTNKSLAFGDRTLAVPNITQLDIEEIKPDTDGPTCGCGCLLVVALFFGASASEHGDFAAGAVAALCVLAALGVYGWMAKQPSDWALKIETNSGSMIALMSKDQQFIRRALGLVRALINAPDIEVSGSADVDQGSIAASASHDHISEFIDR